MADRAPQHEMHVKPGIKTPSPVLKKEDIGDKAIPASAYATLPGLRGEPEFRAIRGCRIPLPCHLPA
jgi:hypothetical protein